MNPTQKVSLTSLQQGSTLNSVHNHIQNHQGIMSQMIRNSDFPAKTCIKKQKFLRHIHGRKM